MPNRTDFDSMIDQLVKEIMMPTEETEETEEMTLVVTPAVATTETVFDFTQPVATFDDETKRAYSILRRVAILARDESGLPDNKIYTLYEVVAILGEDYAQSQVINAGCC